MTSPNHDMFGAVLDAVSEAIVILDASALHVRRMNRHAAALADANGESFNRMVRTMAHSAVRETRGNSKAPPQGARAWVGRSGRFEVLAVRIPADRRLPCESALVILRRLDHEIASIEELRQRHAFTVREAEIARALANGASNRGIAELLGISVHTVRHHVERIFAKLGVTTRKALGVSLLRE